MKKIIPIFLLLCLTLTGCGLSQQARTVNEKYIAPAIEAAMASGRPNLVEIVISTV